MDRQHGCVGVVETGKPVMWRPTFACDDGHQSVTHDAAEDEGGAVREGVQPRSGRPGGPVGDGMGVGADEADGDSTKRGSAGRWTG